MLTRIYIDNFRCFVNFEYRPEQKQLLLGANGSGKSSLLNAIRDLKKFVRGDASPFTQASRTRWDNRATQVLEVEATLDSQKYEYRVELEFTLATKEMSIKLERLSVWQTGKSIFFQRGKRCNVGTVRNYKVGIALREIQSWLLAAEAAVDDHNGQLVLISHHPEILNQWASTHGLRFFRESNGQVRIKS
jgi:ATPase subunit of ABC transporter with duplicated ATPase domains